MRVLNNLSILVLKKITRLKNKNNFCYLFRNGTHNFVIKGVFLTTECMPILKLWMGSKTYKIDDDDDESVG